MVCEGEGDAAEVALAGVVAEGAEDAAVAEVDAVEDADGDGGGALDAGGAEVCEEGVHGGGIVAGGGWGWGGFALRVPSGRTGEGKGDRQGAPYGGGAACVGAGFLGCGGQQRVEVPASAGTTD